MNPLKDGVFENYHPDYIEDSFVSVDDIIESIDNIEYEEDILDDLL
jgi:hypothetical protein